MIVIANLKQTYLDKGYTFYGEGKDWNVNIFGIRYGGTIIDNKFDDAIGIVYYVQGIAHLFSTMGTTQPGAYYMEQPMNDAGTAILVPGQYKGVYQIGLHLGQYEALVQRGKLKIYRDNDRDKEYDLDPKTMIGVEGSGINIHHASNTGVSTFINNWSAGCQVIASITAWNEFMSIIKRSRDLYGNKFTYTLFTEADIISGSI